MYMSGKKTAYFLIGFIIFSAIAFAGIYAAYSSMLNPAASQADTLVFEVSQGSSITSTADDLQSEGLIKNSLAFRIHAKLENYTNLQAGFYEISATMSAKDIAQKIFSGDAVFPDSINVTFPEGKTIDEMAAILGENTNSSSEDILSLWNSSDFIDQAIEDYWFVTEEVKEPNLKYALNGYLFPSTYQFKNKDVTPQEAGKIMLDQMEKVLSKYKDQIDAASMTPHQLLTLASIIEYEAIFDEDRPIVSGVFYNRLNTGMRLQSCATLQMALGVHKQIYSTSDMQVDSPYNTYLVDGLPVGPGNSPGEPSIDAALNPEEHDYYYFLSDIYGDNKTYYSSTLEEHNRLKSEILN
jgi:UPF0755 protein